MKEIIKDKIYLSMSIGCLFALITFISLFFIETTTYFTIMFVLNIIINFVVTMLGLLLDEKKNIGVRFKVIPLYLMVTLFLLILDVVVISNRWNMNVYSILMYVTNTKLYLGIYSVFVLLMVLLSIYVLLKNRLSLNDNNIRQKSSKR